MSIPQAQQQHRAANFVFRNWLLVEKATANFPGDLHEQQRNSVYHPYNNVVYDDNGDPISYRDLSAQQTTPSQSVIEQHAYNTAHRHFYGHGSLEDAGTPIKHTGDYKQAGSGGSDSSQRHNKRK
jgi:hypothetical protein